MATTDILAYATASGANVLAQAAYATQATLGSGMSAGIVPSNYFNKILRQSSFVAAGLAKFCVNQSVNVPDDGNLAALATEIQTAITTLIAATVSTGRTLLSANRTYFVSTGGNDSNNGLTAPTAFLTIQKAVNVIANTIDLGGNTVTISVADGTYTGGVSITNPFVGTGGGTVTITGNTTTPANCIISTTSATAIAAGRGARINVGGFKLTTSGSGYGLISTDGAQITINGTMDFGVVAAGYSQMKAAGFGEINISSNYNITAGGAYHMNSSSGGRIVLDTPITATLSGTPAFASAFANSELMSLLDGSSITFSGAATGTRYIANSNSLINTASSASANYFPGSIAGSAISGGRYI